MIYKKPLSKRFKIFFIVICVLILVIATLTWYLYRPINPSVGSRSFPSIFTLCPPGYQHEGIPVVSTSDNCVRDLSPTSPGFNNTCPSGYEYEGQPFGCVPKGQSDSCSFKPGGCPICLSKDDLIATANGEKLVTKLKIGDEVWSKNKKGQRVLVPVIELGHRAVPTNFSIIKITLKDGRSVVASPRHPTADGRTISSLRVGQTLDGSVITNVASESYNAPNTYDLLPQSDTGYYWANGILLGSTLKN